MYEPAPASWRRSRARDRALRAIWSTGAGCVPFLSPPHLALRFFASRRALTDLPLQALGQDTFSNRLPNVQHISVSGLLLILMLVGASGVVLRSTSSCPRLWTFRLDIDDAHACRSAADRGTSASDRFAYRSSSAPHNQYSIATSWYRLGGPSRRPRAWNWHGLCVLLLFLFPPAGSRSFFSDLSTLRMYSPNGVQTRSFCFPPARSSFLAQSESESGCTSRIQAFKDKTLHS
ncbi:hypothetical protein B0H13DRAFT_2386377 [Mycena leptocephala]|nr:hypothetical protein B0H13DRAFT_2386377 [Mycena leptocephala]